MMLRIDLSKCTGCRRCETACAFFRTGRVNPHLARLKVLSIYETGLDGPVACVQCQERYCLQCPEEALSLGRLGEVVSSPTACRLCGACEKACPIGAVEIFSDIVYICDLCGGRPRCVPACTEEAIRYEQTPGPPPSLQDVKARSRRLNPSQKRRLYLQRQGQTLRKKWRPR